MILICPAVSRTRLKLGGETQWLGPDSTRASGYCVAAETPGCDRCNGRAGQTCVLGAGRFPQP
ncbi:hypothetical protein [Paenibacillus sp. USHLN196]|uniref:hypothetical protein n=1 Tax=Paenibacillus sp. USHLN196 TaxID=3081291 RepID=UPI0030177D0F